MNKSDIAHLLTEKYSSFIEYINGLSPEELIYSYEQKWTALQQLEHIVICVKPLVQVFSMDKAAIEQNFGIYNNPGRSYDNLLTDYTEKLKEGGKAPSRYLPETILPEQRHTLNETLVKLIEALCSKIDTFTEQELDTLAIPHPLLGNISLREMLYNAIYHVEHHQTATIENLKHK